MTDDERIEAAKQRARRPPLDAFALANDVEWLIRELEHARDETRWLNRRVSELQQEQVQGAGTP